MTSYILCTVVSSFVAVDEKKKRNWHVITHRRSQSLQVKVDSGFWRKKEEESMSEQTVLGGQADGRWGAQITVGIS